MPPSMKEIRKVSKKTYWNPIQKASHWLAMYITWVFARMPITPNQVTILWGLIQTLAPLLFLKGTYPYMLIGIFIYHFGFLIDCVDGQLARYKKHFSIKGIYLDQLAHHISIPVFFASLSIGVYKIYNDTIYLAFGALAVLSFLYNKVFTVDIPSQAKSTDINESFSLKTKNKLIAFIFGMIRIEHPLNIMFWLILFQLPHYALMGYAVLFFLEMIRKLITALARLEKLDKKSR